MNILFYSPYNQRARDAESTMIALQRKGNVVFSLSQSSGDGIHDFLKLHNVRVFEYQIPRTSELKFFFLHALFLVRFCWKYRIHVVYSHLESANFVVAISQFFIRSKAHLVRHHIDEAYLRGFNKNLTYRLTYRLAKSVFVVSKQARQFMIDKEGVPEDKIHVVKLGYDFSLFKIDFDQAQVLRSKAECEILLVSAGRFTDFKRFDQSIQVVKMLIDSGCDAKLLLLGRGESEISLKNMVGKYGISEKVIFPGHVQNVVDYVAAADFLLHPSVLESSCVIVNEAGLCKTPVIACRHVGDFDDYLNVDNSFLVNKDHFVDEAFVAIKSALSNRVLTERITENLNKTVTRLFTIENVIEEYERLNAK